MTHFTPNQPVVWYAADVLHNGTVIRVENGNVAILAEDGNRWVREADDPNLYSADPADMYGDQY